MAIPILCFALISQAITASVHSNDTHGMNKTMMGHISSNYSDYEGDYDTKHESLQNCLSYDLEPDEYVVYPNGTAFVPLYQMTYNESYYILQDGFLTVCAPPEEPPKAKRSIVLDYLTDAGMIISIICLSAHLIVFALVPDLRNLPGWNLAALCVSLITAYVSHLTVEYELVEKMTNSCVAAAVFIQFSYLSSFMWMFLMSFDVFKTIFMATGSLRVTLSGFKLKKFIWNVVAAWGVALVFTSAALIADTEGAQLPDVYRPQFRSECWFIHKRALLTFFAGPVLILICFNFFLFALSTYSILTNRMEAGQESQQSNARRDNMLYFRLSVIMGLTWIIGVICPIFDTDWLWYLHVIFNTLQGLFIFVAFTLCKKVKTFVKKKLLGNRRVSETTLTQNVTPTFQSYCFYANHREKDTDRVVNGKKEDKVPMEEVAVHL